MMTTLIAKNHMSCAGIFFARTGHTHGPLGYSIAGVRILRFCQVENVKASKFHVSLFLCCMRCQDQLFGLIAAAIRYVDLICDVPDLVQILAATFRKVGNRFQVQEKWA